MVRPLSGAKFAIALIVEESALTFARNFFKNPRMLGSVIPSSRWLVDQLLRDVEWDRARVLVEFGPGVGTITREILKRMRPDATLVALELNDEFVQVLRDEIADSRLRVAHRSAEAVNDVLRDLGQPKADYLLAGIPFSILSEEQRQDVIRSAYEALRDDGVMLVYQFSGRVRADLERMFAHVHQKFEPRNILPARVFHCVK